MSLSSLVKKGSKLIGVNINRTVPSLGNKLAGYDIKKEDFEDRGDHVFFKKLNIALPWNKAMPVIEGYNNALKLLVNKNAFFFADENGGLHVKIDNIEFSINDEEELFIIGEVFLEGAYNLASPTHKKIAVIDIGMNVGVTSLFFAGRENVEKIFSFEPFTPTYNMAKENIRLNPTVSHKLHPNNFGLGKAEGFIEIPYSLKQKGRMGINGLPVKSAVVKNDAAIQTIQLKPVKDEFEAIRPQVEGHFVICKMDCEGAEYELIESLFENNLLSMPDAYFIEWHYKSPGAIIDSLMKCNFNVINTTFPQLNSGMIYALKNHS